jgi:hypothetical protein
MPEPQVTVQQRILVAQRAAGCCEYCFSQARFSPDPFSVEHIVPRAQGGTDELENLALACQGCNNRKYIHTSARDPVTGEVVPLYHPRNHRWYEHFTWSEDYSLLLGLTPLGRATVVRLHLNREGVVNLRLVLRTVHEHPPTEVFGKW